MRHAALLPLLAFVLAACGGSGGGATPVATNEVVMPKSYRFDPETIEVERGATVTWRNEDNFTHTVQVEGQPDREVEPGESIEIRFTHPGTYEYVCTLHSHDMRGTVIVR